MALKKALQITKPGFEGALKADAAYWKVEKVYGTKETVSFEVSTAVSGVIVQQSSYQFTPDLNGGNFIEQAYLYLKTLAEFSGAEDC